jgi:hypothetical protein
MGERMSPSLPQYELKNRISRLLFGSHQAKTIYNLEVPYQMKWDILPSDLRRNPVLFLTDDWKSWDVNFDEPFGVIVNRLLGRTGKPSQTPIVEPKESDYSMFQRPVSEPQTAEQVLIPMPPPLKETPRLPEKKRKRFSFLR